MKILAIETSCDETAICILEANGELESPTFNILGNSLISQIDVHKVYGGVYPMLAKREHEKNLPVLLEKTLKEAQMNLENPKIDYISVTSGPGLEPALWTGILFAEELGRKWSKPVIPINHMEGHIYSPLYHSKDSIEFPALALLVSGGHTELVHIKDFGTYEIIGKTRDDATGEAFDKVARLLGLEYPGGPKVSQKAEAHRAKGLTPTFSLPRPMINTPDYDFSFSGLKTAVLYKLKGMEVDEALQEELSHEFENAVVEVLIEKTKRALEALDVKTLILAGGVANNKFLRAEIIKLAQNFSPLKLLIPEPSLTTDNAVMIGIATYIKLLKNPTLVETLGEKIIAKGNLSL